MLLEFNKEGEPQRVIDGIPSFGKDRLSFFGRQFERLPVEPPHFSRLLVEMKVFQFATTKIVNRV